VFRQDLSIELQALKKSMERESVLASQKDPYRHHSPTTTLICYVASMLKDGKKPDHSALDSYLSRRRESKNITHSHRVRK